MRQEKQIGNVISKVFLLLSVHFIFGRINGVQSSCTSMREGFKCEANESSNDIEFKINLSNNGSEDVKLDVFKKLGDCRKMSRPPGGNGPPPPFEQKNPKDLEKEGIKFEKDLTVPKGGKLTVALDKGKAPFCSFAILKNCRNSANVRMDCASLLAIN